MKPNKQIVTAVISAALLTGGAAFGQSGDAILDLLTKKGVISQKEANDAREQLDAQNAQTFDAYNKIKVSSWVNNLQFFGDGRLRYEWRSGTGNAGTGAAYDNASLDRFRYRLRFGVKGEFLDDFSYGLRLETGTKGNSANVTMGGQGFSGSPWAKGGNDAIELGQFWAQYKVANGWRPDWLTLIGGRFETPFIQYGMGWKDDINPEGFAQKFLFKTEKVDYFLTLGEFTYNNTAKQDNFGTGASGVDTWLLGIQGGGTVKITKDISVRLAPSFYTYTNPDSTTLGIFAPTLAAGNITGVNKLNVFALPGEVAFPIPGINLPGKVFGEFDINVTGDERAAKAGWSGYGAQDIAYQVGAQIGSTKKKHDWLLKAYWQHVELNSLDPNLVNSDYFDQRMNMQGIVASGTYMFTDFLSATLTYADAKAINSALPTLTGTGDLAGNLRSYDLIQADLNWKF